MTLDQIQVLVEVVEGGSFQAAATALYRSRSAISVAVKNLEKEIGIQIFLRDSYRPTLSPEGKMFYQKAKKLLNNADDLFSLGKKLSEGDEPEITLVVDTFCPIPSIMVTLHLFQLDFPSTKINLSIEPGKIATQMLQENKTDLAITTQAKFDPAIESLEWITIKLLPVASPDFPLAQMEDVPLEEALNYVQIVVKDKDNEVFESIMQENKGEFWSVSDFHAKKQFLLSALGWGLMPDYLIQRELHTQNLVPLKIQNLKEVVIQLYLLRRLDRYIGRASQKIWEISKGKYD